MLREHWDRFAFYAMFAGYGIWSLFTEAAVMAAAPRWVAWPTYGLFVLAAILLTFGFARNNGAVYVAGNAVGVIALTSVTTAAIAVASSPGSMLVVALALGLIIMLRRNRSDNAALEEITAGMREFWSETRTDP